MSNRRLGLEQTRRRAATWPRMPPEQSERHRSTNDATANGRAKPPKSHAPNRSDDAQARWGRERHLGFPVGRYLQPPPLLFTADHHPVWLGDFYRGRSAFLICGGPSFASLDHTPLRQPGILTMAVNNAVKTFRPNLWASVDSPSNFIRSTWLDPTILKFVPICHANKPIFNSDRWEWMDVRARDCPSVLHFKRNEHFQADQYLWEDTINWGNHKNFGGGRSVMLVALRLLFVLGVREVYLLGADFTMSSRYTYHFDQSRTGASVRGNMRTYKKLNQWFRQLRPLFERERFYVYNCNPDSHLTAFDFLPYQGAIERAKAAWGNVDVERERTAGQYSDKKPEPKP